MKKHYNTKLYKAVTQYLNCQNWLTDVGFKILINNMQIYKILQLNNCLKDKFINQIF